MSMPNKATVNCPDCNAAFTTTVWSSVNTDLSEDLAEKIISGEFFDAKCPECGFTAHMEYDVLYHDVKRSVMIWVVHTNTPEYEKKCAEIKSTRMLPGYKTRMVRDMNELREKVAALEAGRDDRVIEICKYFLKYEASQQHPEFETRNLFYTYADGKEIVFLYDINGKDMSCYLDPKLYDMMEERFSERLLEFKDNDYAIYDAQWAEKLFLQHLDEDFDDEINEDYNDNKEGQLTLFDALEDDNSSSEDNKESPTISNKKTSCFEGNPYLVLGVSCLDDRRKIISAAEDMSFLSDADECTEAQNTLITPNKRLSAELDWFIETDISLLNEIKTCLNNNNPIFIDNLNDLSKLNAMIYNCCISDEADSFSLGLEILDIDKQFGELNPITLTEIINNCRKIAKMAEATESDVSIELSKKRVRIRSIISEKLQSLSESDYVELVTLFAEKYIADDEYNDSGIISDIIDQYEIWAKSIMESKEEKIRECIDSIKKIDNDSKMKQAVSNLIALIKEWDMYAQPLQVTLTSRGVEDRNSRDIAIDIRDLAIYLHNEKGETALSLEITEALKVYFAELSEVLEVVSKDSETLQRLQKEKEEFELKKKQNKRADKKYSVGIFGERFVIPPFCTCCMKPTENKENVSYSITIPNGNTRTTRTIGIDMPICNECLEHRNKYNGFLVLICSAAIVVAGIIMALFMLAEVDGFFSFLLSSGVAIGVYYLLSHLIKTKELGIEHSTRGKSAEIFSLFMGAGLSSIRNKMNLPDVTFTFTNWEYAQLFSEANGEQAGEVKEKVDVNTAKSTSFLKANAHHVATMFKMLAAFAVVALIIGAIISESGSTSSYSSSSYNSSSSYSSSSSSSSSTYNSSSSSVEKQFSQSVSSGTKVYANIVSIFPEMGIYTQGSSNYSSFVCKCKTSAGTTVWVHMSVSEYRSNFDSSASSSIYNEYAEEVTFSTSKKIRGTAKTSNSVLSGLSTDIGASMLIDFTSVN